MHISHPTLGRGIFHERITRTLIGFQIVFGHRAPTLVTCCLFHCSQGGLFWWHRALGRHSNGLKSRGRKKETGVTWPPKSNSDIKVEAKSLRARSNRSNTNRKRWDLDSRRHYHHHHHNNNNNNENKRLIHKNKNRKERNQRNDGAASHVWVVSSANGE